MNLFIRLFGKRAKVKSLDGIEESFSPTQFDQNDPLVIDTRMALSPDGRQAVYREIAKSTGFPMHEVKRGTRLLADRGFSDRSMSQV